MSERTRNIVLGPLRPHSVLLLPTVPVPHESLVGSSFEREVVMKTEPSPLDDLGVRVVGVGEKGVLVMPASKTREQRTNEESQDDASRERRGSDDEPRDSVDDAGMDETS